MDIVKGILSRVQGLIKKIKVWRIVAVVVVVALLYQVITTVMMCSVVLDWDKLSASPQAQQIIIKDLSTQQYKDWLQEKASDDYIENDGLKLHALSIVNKGQSSSYVIMLHPATCSAIDMAQFAYHFYDLGFNIVLPDARGCGESEGDTLTFGVDDARDVPLWVDKIIELDPDAAIFLYGLGMGGSAVTVAAGEQLPANVKGVIEDSGYNDLEAVFKHNIDSLYNKKSFPGLAIAKLYAKSVKGWSYDAPLVEESVKNIKIPILFIHGGDDQIVPVDQSNDMFEACRGKGSDHVYMTGAAHCRAMHTDSVKYWRVVDEFILDNME
ncbi:MAG: alpha/beta hydrolase [Clostridia bacterium]|nr:alpha/beta hydrolase [Clostridia bacterium]